MKTKWIEGESWMTHGEYICPKCGYSFVGCPEKREVNWLPNFCPKCGENMQIDSEKVKSGMGSSDFFMNLGRGMKIMEENMSIEEAVSIIDPIKNQNVSNNSNNVSFEKTFNGLRDMKARFVVINYVKEKLEKEKNTKN